LKAIKAPVFPKNWEDKLYDLGNKAVEQEHIEKGEYLITNVVDTVVPVRAHGKGLAASGVVDLSSDASIDGYIKSFNDQAQKDWEGAAKSTVSKARPGVDPFLDAGIPIGHLTYGNDFLLMLLRSDYRLRDGSVISKYTLQRTMPILRDRIRADPYGHVYERLFLLGSDEIVREGLAAGEQLRFAAEIERTISNDQLIERLKDVLDPELAAISNQIKAAIQELWDAIQNRESGIASGTANAFMPIDVDVGESIIIDTLGLSCREDELRAATLNACMETERENGNYITLRASLR
jgi:hypothetical protein